jgi:hypothetical protein
VQRLLTIFERLITLPHQLQPHSLKWFETFKQTNPLQAELVSKNIDRTGHANICTACGDPPCGDFLLQLPNMTLRLCKPCGDIYSRTYGKRLVAL